jgi:hypothetical protein
MNLATKRKLVLYLTPLIMACIRIEWSFKGMYDFRAWAETDPTRLYVESLVGWCVWLIGLWLFYGGVILVTACVVGCAMESLGWMRPDPQKVVSDEMHVIVTLTWLVITLGGWLIQCWPGRFDSD